MYDHEILTEDLHSSQLLKKIIDKYVGLPLITYKWEMGNITRKIYYIKTKLVFNNNQLKWFFLREFDAFVPSIRTKIKKQ